MRNLAERGKETNRVPRLIGDCIRDHDIPAVLRTLWLGSRDTWDVVSYRMCTVRYSCKRNVDRTPQARAVRQLPPVCS
eukprot:6848884-Prymnesium_polylepis.1